jgi:hypothetical protein
LIELCAAIGLDQHLDVEVSGGWQAGVGGQLQRHEVHDAGRRDIRRERRLLGLGSS